MRTLTISFITFLFVQLNVNAQDTISTLNVENDSLHTLNFYMESAILNSPMLKMHESFVGQKELELQLLKYAWMREIYVTADTKFGNYGNTNPLEQFNLGYGTGAFIRLPLSAFVGSSERKRIAKLGVEASKFQKSSLEEELKKLVITQYNEVLLRKSLIDIQVQATDVALLNYKIAEEEFKGGVINVDAFSRTSQIFFTQMSALEKIKSEYKNSKEILFEICGNN